MARLTQINLVVVLSLAACTFYRSCDNGSKLSGIPGNGLMLTNMWIVPSCPSKGNAASLGNGRVSAFIPWSRKESLSASATYSRCECFAANALSERFFHSPDFGNGAASIHTPVFENSGWPTLPPPPPLYVQLASDNESSISPLKWLGSKSPIVNTRKCTPGKFRMEVASLFSSISRGRDACWSWRRSFSSLSARALCVAASFSFAAASSVALDACKFRSAILPLKPSLVCINAPRDTPKPMMRTRLDAFASFSPSGQSAKTSPTTPTITSASPIISNASQKSIRVLARIQSFGWFLIAAIALGRLIVVLCHNPSRAKSPVRIRKSKGLRRPNTGRLRRLCL